MMAMTFFFSFSHHYGDIEEMGTASPFGATSFMMPLGNSIGSTSLTMIKKKSLLLLKLLPPFATEDHRRVLSGSVDPDYHWNPMDVDLFAPSLLVFLGPILGSGSGLQ